MTQAELAKLRAEFIDGRQDALLKSASALERTLFDLVVSKFVELFDQSNGNLVFNNKNVSATFALEKVFEEFERTEKTRLTSRFVSDIQKITDLNIQYNEKMAADLARFKTVSTRVNDLMKNRLGITDGGRLRTDGFLDSFIKDTEVKTLVREKIMNAVTKQTPIKDFVKDIRTTITGTEETDGAITSKYKNTIFDVYQQHDRATSKTFARDLGLRVFTYTGGIIETSREFCRVRNNKTFTIDEAAEWVNDPVLPRTTAERSTGIQDYDPLIDCGRWNCRHHVNFVSNARAVQLRPELQGYIYGDVPVTAGRPTSVPVSAPTRVPEPVKPPPVAEKVSLGNMEKQIIETTKNKYEEAAVFTSSGEFVFHKKGNKSSVGFTPEELAKMSGGIITHNHPSSGWFSHQDILLTMATGVKEMRAIAPNTQHGSIVWKLENLGLPSDKFSMTIIKRLYERVRATAFERTNELIRSGKIEGSQANNVYFEMHAEIFMEFIESGTRYSKFKNKFKFSWEKF